MDTSLQLQFHTDEVNEDPPPQVDRLDDAKEPVGSITANGFGSTVADESKTQENPVATSTENSRLVEVANTATVDSSVSSSESVTSEKDNVGMDPSLLLASSLCNLIQSTMGKDHLSQENLILYKVVRGQMSHAPRKPLCCGKRPI